MSALAAPGVLAFECLCCAFCGVLAGALRALAPAKGRAAFVPDLLLVGTLAVLLQSYAASESGEGTLRWYMAASGALGAWAAHSLLNVPLSALRRLALRLARNLEQKALRPVLERRKAHARKAKERRHEKKVAKNCKKSLQKQSHLLYNSNV